MNKIRRLVALALSVSIFFVSACTSKEDSSLEEKRQPKQPSGIILSINGSTYVPDVTRELQVDFTSGVTVRKALQSSGLVELGKEGDRINSVGSVSLDQKLTWGVSLNGTELTKSEWDQQLNKGDELDVFVQSSDRNKGQMTPNTVLLKANGALSNPSIRHYYVMMYTEGLTVRDLVIRSGFVALDEHQNRVRAINGYMPKVTEKWVIEVNHKKLLDGAIDIKLKPGDQVELILDHT